MKGVIKKVFMSAPQKKKVVIIGAGASGLGAARWLVDNDVLGHLEVHVLEARDRIGGRVYTANAEAGLNNADARGLYDLGASWVHDPGPSNPINIMADTIGAALLPTDFDDDVVYNLEGKKFSDREAITLYEEFEIGLFTAAVKARKRADENRYISLEETAQRQISPSKWRHPLMQLYAAGFEFELGTPLRNCSSVECIDEDWIRAEEDGDDDGDDDPIFPVTGFGAVIDGLLSGAATDNDQMRPQVSLYPIGPGDDPPVYVSGKPISYTLNAAVTSVVQGIEGSERSCRVTATIGGSSEGGSLTHSWDADVVISTLPIGVMKAGSVEFIPGLPSDKLTAIAQTGVGNVVKIILEFKKIFWDNNATFFGIADEQLCTEGRDSKPLRGLCIFFMNGFKLCRKKVLVAYAIGDGADIADMMNDEELLQLCISRVSCLARPGQTAVPPIRMTRTRWAEDPYSLGAYSYWAKGNVAGIRNLIRRPEGNIWFAGEALHESSLLSSSVCGAWVSGVEVAADVCRQLGVPVITEASFGHAKVTRDIKSIDCHRCEIF